MILQALHDLYERLEDDDSYGIAPPGYSNQKITFKVVLHPDGRLVDIQSETLDGKPRHVRVLGVTKPSGSGINPRCLWDNASYLLGYTPDSQRKRRSQKEFNGFRDWHLSREDEVSSPAFSAVCRFLESWSPERADDFSVLAETKTGFGVFQLVGQPCYVHQNAVIDAWWREHPSAEDKATPKGQCLLTGTHGPLARLHPKVKGAASGDALLVCFDKESHQSYGKKQSFNAPVSKEAAFRYGAALNALLDGRMRHKHRMTLADTTVAFWTERPCMAEDIFTEFAEHGDALLAKEESQDEDLRHRLEIFLNALREGVEVYGELGEDTENIRFYMLGLSPNQGRLAVRFFLRGTVRELLDNLRKHHRDMAIVREYGDSAKRPDPEFPPMWLLLRQTARDSKEIPPVLAGPLMRSIVTGTRYPDGLYGAVLRRIRADREIGYVRACILKAHLVRNRNEEVSMSLDRERKDPAYRLGRLFAALEKTQEDQPGTVKATIRDRFYSAASATPRTVFPRLLRTYQHHLAKLGGGLKVVREQLVQEIIGPLDAFPAHFGLNEQGLFAIGYYHQKKDLYTSMKSKQEGDDT